MYDAVFVEVLRRRAQVAYQFFDAFERKYPSAFEMFAERFSLNVFADSNGVSVLFDALENSLRMAVGRQLRNTQIHRNAAGRERFQHEFLPALIDSKVYCTLGIQRTKYFVIIS